MIPELDINQHILEAVPLPTTVGGTAYMLVTGSNATGKSFLRRILYANAKANKGWEVWQFSQQLKTAQWSKIFLGDENEESTGCISVHNILKAFRLLSEDQEKKRFIIWDEPEIGMSEETQRATAIRFRQEFSQLRPNVMGVVWITHSRFFVQELQHLPSLQWINLDGYQTPESWLLRPIKPTPLELLERNGYDRWRAVNKALNALKTDNKGSS